jgi:polyferredoxin
MSNYKDFRATGFYMFTVFGIGIFVGLFIASLIFGECVCK